MTEDPNPLPQPVGTVNRITPLSQDANGAVPAAPSATPTAPQVISSIEDVLAFLAASHSCVVIAVSKRAVVAKPGTKPLAVNVLHAGDPGDALKLAQVAASVLQGA